MDKNDKNIPNQDGEKHESSQFDENSAKTPSENTGESISDGKPVNTPANRSVEDKADKPVKKPKEELYGEKIYPVNHKFAAVAIAVFMAILVLPMLSWGILKIIDIYNPQVMEELDFELDEQRELAQFPREFDPATITADIEAYFNDHVPFRSVIITAQRQLDDFLEKPYRDYIRPALIELFYSDYGSPDPGNEGGSGVGNFGDMFGDPTESEETTEAETLPESETLEGGDENCDHVLDEGLIEKEATCSDFGVILRTCEKCGYKVREYTAKLPHQYTETDREGATCTQNGYIEYKCSVCGYSYRQTIRAEGHDGEFVRKVEPTYEDFGYTLYRCKKCGVEYRDDIVDKLVDPSYFPPRLFNNITIEGRDNWLFYYGDDSVSYYQGGNIMSESQMADWLSVMEQLQRICDEKGIQLQLMLMPNKEIVYSEYMPSYTVYDQYRRSQRFADYVHENSDVNFIYPLEELLAAKPYWQVYYKHDTHWNSAGAFIGTQALYGALGMPTTNLLDLPFSEQNRVGGDLISLGGLSNSYGRDTEYSIPYRSDVNVLSSVGDRQGSGTLHTTSDSENDKHFVMLSDSFRISMIPFLEKDFSECTITHRDNIGQSDVNNAIKDADILVLAAVERYDYQLIDAARRCIEILSE